MREEWLPISQDSARASAALDVSGEAALEEQKLDAIAQGMREHDDESAMVLRVVQDVERDEDRKRREYDKQMALEALDNVRKEIDEVHQLPTSTPGPSTPPSPVFTNSSQESSAVKNLPTKRKRRTRRMSAGARLQAARIKSRNKRLSSLSEAYFGIVLSKAQAFHLLDEAYKNRAFQRSAQRSTATMAKTTPSVRGGRKKAVGSKTNSRKPAKARAGSTKVEEKSPLVNKADIVLPLLQSLSDVKPTNRRSILLSHLDDEACELLYETIRHVIQSENLPPRAKNHLAKALGPHKKDIMSVAGDSGRGGGKRSRALKRKKLAQMGGFPIGAVLRFAIPILLSAISGK